MFVFIANTFATKAKAYIEVLVTRDPRGYHLVAKIYGGDWKHPTQTALQDYLDIQEDHSGSMMAMVSKANDMVETMKGKGLKYPWNFGEDAFALRKKLFAPGHTSGEWWK